MATLLTRPATLLRIEGATLLALGLLLYAFYGSGWTLFLLLVLAPDLSMVGYVFGSRAGGASYNAAHTWAVPAVLAVAGLLVGSSLILSLGLVWIVHVGFDRAMGFGLKYPTGFWETHLGRIGGV